jgi:outer membrane protein assembly factor BamB
LADRDRIQQIVQQEALSGASVRAAGDMVLLVRAAELPGAADWSHAEANAASTGASEDEFIRSPMSILWFDAARRWHKFPGQVHVRVAGGRLVLFEEGVLQASDVYTGHKFWEVAVPLGAQPLDDPQARQAVRYAKHRQWGPQASLPSAAELVVVRDAIYLSAGTACRVFDPATGRPAGRIELPQHLDAPWSNLRVADDYLVGSSGNHVLCIHRRTKELLWELEASRAALSLAVGGGKLFCAELANPRHGEDETRDGRTFAVDIATGERLWQRPGGARLRYSPSLDIIVTPTGFYRGVDGEPLPHKSDSAQTRMVVQGNRLPEPGVPGYIAGNRLLTGTEDSLVIYDLPSGEPVGELLEWARRGCTATRASTHLLTTRYRANSAWIDLDSRDITPMLGIRPGCSVNNNLYPANGVLNIPNLTAGCTCNYAPVSMACVPADVVTRGSGE